MRNTEAYFTTLKRDMDQVSEQADSLRVILDETREEYRGLCACATDGGAVKAARTLLDHGYKNVRAFKGGWTAWNEAGGAVEPK